MKTYFIFAILTLTILSVKAESFDLDHLLKDSVLQDLDGDLRQAVMVDLEAAFDNYTKEKIGIVLSPSPDKNILMAMFFKKSNSVTKELLLYVNTGQREKAYDEINYNPEFRYFAEIFKGKIK